jgi:colanic acid/amylovoran biosynthesis glycosyltransferase
VIHPFAYVCKVFPRASETFVINELRALEQLGERPAVYSLHRNPTSVSHAILEDLHAPVTVVDEVEVTDHDAKKAGQRLARELDVPESERGRYLPRKYVRLALALARLAERDGTRHLHAHFASRAGHVAALAAALGGGSYSLTAHAKDIYHREVDTDLLAWKIRGAQFAITVTDYNRRHLAALPGIDAAAASRLVRLYNGVDLGRFAIRDGSRSSPPLLASIGRLVEKKGFDVLIEACALLRERGLEFRCEIIGGGELEPALRKRALERGVDRIVRFTGSLATERVAERLGKASIVALPCIVGADGNVDALPTALLEGMACGLPLVSTKLSGIPEIVIDGENGLLVEPGSASALADALAVLLLDPRRARDMGRAGRRRAEALFDLQANVALLRGLLRSACAVDAPAHAAAVPSGSDRG